MTEPRTIATLLGELDRAQLVVGDAAAAFLASNTTPGGSEPGTLFVAVPGFVVDGHAYLRDVTAKGAAALLVQRDHRAAWQSLVAGAEADIHGPADYRGRRHANGVAPGGGMVSTATPAANSS